MHQKRLDVETVSEAIATWVPAPLLAVVVIGLAWWIFKNLSKRFDKVEAALDILPKLATKEELGNMGNRFDERHSALRERVSVLEALSK